MVGRFINADSQLNSGILGKNLYAYCENNPINRIDPYGTDFWDILNGVWKVVVESAEYASIITMFVAPNPPTIFFGLISMGSKVERIFTGGGIYSKIILSLAPEPIINNYYFYGSDSSFGYNGTFYYDSYNFPSLSSFEYPKMINPVIKSKVVGKNPVYNEKVAGNNLVYRPNTSNTTSNFKNPVYTPQSNGTIINPSYNSSTTPGRLTTPQINRLPSIMWC